MKRVLIALAAIISLILVVSCSTGTIVYGDVESSETAMVFYPGGKVDPYAYEDLCSSLSEQGIPVIVAKMPFNLAVLDMNAATDIVKSYPEVETWYFCGHSLGGAMVSSWCAKHPDIADGLVFLAAYPTKDISVPTLSLYGSNDGVLNMERYEKNILLVQNLEEHIIEGGNHCQFGDYGFQKGDNPATIDRETQTDMAVSYIVEFINSHI